MEILSFCEYKKNNKNIVGENSDFFNKGGKMNYFLIDDQKLIIKELTTEEQENFNNFEPEDFLDKKSFEELCEQFLVNKEKFQYDIFPAVPASS